MSETGKQTKGNSKQTKENSRSEKVVPETSNDDFVEKASSKVVSKRNKTKGSMVAAKSTKTTKQSSSDTNLAGSKGDTVATAELVTRKRSTGGTPHKGIVSKSSSVPAAAKKKGISLSLSAEDTAVTTTNTQQKVCDIIGFFT